MAEIHIEHTFACSEQTFWGKIFFDEEYNRRLFKDSLHFPVWKQISLEERGSEVERVVEASPPIGDLPGALKSVIGDNAGYRERAVFDREKRRCTIRVTPNRLADKVTVSVELWTEAAGDNRCKRLVKASASAKIFGIGGLLEKKLLSDLERSYAKSAEFTNAFVAEKGL